MLRASRRTLILAGALMALALTTGATAALAPSSGARAGGSAVQIAAITLTPQAVTLRNPAARGGHARTQRIRVALHVLDSQGNPITAGTFTQPIRVRVYGPRGVLNTSTPVIRTPTSAVSFTYTGAFVANPVIVTAVAGHAYALMSFQPAHRGFPGSGSVTFPMPNAARNFANGWHFSASVGGGPAHDVEMDTGSRGVVVPQSALGPEAVGPGAPGQIEYTSDGKIFSGNYYLTPLRLSAHGTTVTTVPIQVLAVSKASCDPHFSACTPGNLAGVGMLGVGFARGTVSQTPPELSNAFLALNGAIRGTMDPGYTVTPTSVTLGITPTGSAGYHEIPLTAGGTGPGDWNTEPGCFAFPQIAGSGSQCGTVLVDTGIASAILGLSRSLRPAPIAGAIPTGTSVQFAAPTPSAPAFSYTFAAGDGQPMTPTAIRWAAGAAPFVNTGRRLIAGYDYLFDDGAGRVGFQANPTATAAAFRHSAPPTR